MADAATDVEMAEVKAQAHEGDQTAAAPMENGNAQIEAPAAEEPVAPPNPLVTQYNEQWDKVCKTPSDFTAWTNLITTAEKLDDLERLRGVYESFLASYPLCYGYWKKYADAENRHQSVEGALAVYERGVRATPYSMDLWGHYAIYKKNNGGTPEDVRGIYERALAYNGSDYLGHQLWDKYIHYEEEQGNALHVVALYCRAINYPLRELNRYMNSLKAFIQGRTSAEIMSAEESASLMETLTASKQAQAAKAAEEAASAPPEKAEELAAAAAAFDTSVTDDEIKAAWLSAREPGFDAAKKVAEARRQFEEGIKRSYFHVKVLDTPQLSNWVRYLDFMESQEPEDLAATVTTYERCLVPCANYPEFWERYVGYLESKNMKAEADAALQRAVTVFCRTRPEMFIFAARQEERRGNIDAARPHLKTVLDTLAPTLLAGIAAAANFERRQGKISDACAIWEAALEREKSSTGSSNKLYAYMAVHYATFLREVAAQVDKARTVLKDALGVASNIRSLWEAAIHLELTVGGPDVYKRVAPLFECACAEPPAPQGDGSAPVGLSEKDREEMSERHVDIADEYGDAAALHAAVTAHMRRFTLPSSFASAANTAAADASASRKRAASETPEHQPAKAARPEPAAAPAAAAAPAPAAAAAHGYHGYPPAPAAAAAYPPYSAPAYGHYGYGYPSQPYPAGGYGYGY